MFTKLLIANRGEIACRIARTARKMGLEVATVHSTADAAALHVREIGESVLLGGGPARESYLNIEAVIAAALKVGAQAVHPGFGFLSENPAFARRCAEEGLLFVGPTPEVLALFGDKSQAKNLAEQLGIPTAGGLREPSDDPQQLMAALESLPLPYILKAVAGGGGKGMRVVRDRNQVRESIEAAIREGQSSFGDGRLIGERYLEAPRHVEVQILGDGQGNVIHLFDRECTLQRRHQKVIEEAPVTSLPEDMRRQLWEYAVSLGKASNYLGLGTVEFAVTSDGAVFLEVNPRLQVEHPVTEAVTGLDLVEHQIRTIAHRTLSVQGVQQTRGAAIQARLYAEDADQNFMPSTGVLTVFEPAVNGVRIDTGVESGSPITPFYDPMIAKIIAHGDSRESAIDMLREALGQTTVLGVTSNKDFLGDLLGEAAVRENKVSTEFIDKWLASRSRGDIDKRTVAVLAALWLADSRASQTGSAWDQWHGFTAWRMHRGGSQLTAPAGATWLVRSGSSVWKVGFGHARQGGVMVFVDTTAFVVQAPRTPGRGVAVVDDASLSVTWSCRGGEIDAQLLGRAVRVEIASIAANTRVGSAASLGTVRAPMMGQVIAVHVREGQAVQAGERLATLESMKMEMAISAPVAGSVKSVNCQMHSKVERNQELFSIEVCDE